MNRLPYMLEPIRRVAKPIAASQRRAAWRAEGEGRVLPSLKQACAGISSSQGDEMTRSRARTTGAVYLLYFVTAISAAYLVGRVPVTYSDAANLIANAIYVILTLLLYQILKPVSRSLALLAVLISIVGCIVQSLSLFHLTSPQSSLLFFGFFNLTIGYLILKSTFLPRILGILMGLSGLGWLTYMALTFLSPDLLRYAKMYIEIIGIAAEGLLMLWLLVMGVNVQRWDEQAATAAR